MIALLLKSKTGIFRSLEELSAMCGYVPKCYMKDGEFAAMQLVIRKHYSVEDLFAMDIDNTNFMRLGVVYEIK